jgi:nitric oxide reductase NorD protein
MKPISTQSPLDSATLQKRLEGAVYMVLSVRRSVEQTAAELGQLPRPRQERFLEAVEYIAAQTGELAYNFCIFGTRSARLLGEDEWESWIQHLLDTYDRSGVMGSITAMQKIGEFVEAERRAGAGAVRLAELRRMLASFVTALSGRGLEIEPGDRTYSDTQTLFLPDIVTTFADPSLNRRLYKAMAAHLWAQSWYGTWRMPLSARLAVYDDRQRALQLFHALETLRLDACIARDLPGLHRQLLALRLLEPGPVPAPIWRRAQRRLGGLNATVNDSHALLAELYPAADQVPTCCYQGELRPEATEAVIQARKERDRVALGVVLAELREELAGQPDDGQAQGVEAQFQVRRSQGADSDETGPVQLLFQGEAVVPHQDVQQLLESVLQDMGHIPEDYLVPAGHGRYRGGGGYAARDAAGHAPEQGDHVYDEWDYQRKHYRKGWCLLKQRDVRPIYDQFVERTLDKHRGLLRQLYRTFEALRGEDRRLRKQPEGDGVDIDAVVESYADHRAGLEWSEHQFTERKRLDRDVAVMFLVDMSGSTRGWINELERESLVLLCESLETLGDRYAIYGFSGFTHKRCELLRIKRLDEPYTGEVRARISGIKPGDYTRLGVFIRHLTREFQDVDARTKLLITLSDGRPDDQDGYRGDYGIEDTRQALLEARYQDVHPYCITIDDQAMDYLPHMYGPANFTVVSAVHKLPYKVSDIYRRITR